MTINSTIQTMMRPVVLAMGLASPFTGAAIGQQSTSPTAQATNSNSPAELAKPVSELKGDDRVDELHAKEVIKKEDLQHKFVRRFPRDLAEHGLTAYMTMIEQDEFKEHKFEVYTLDKKLFFFDKKPDGELYLVDKFKPGSFDFTKLHHKTQDPILQKLLKNFREQRQINLQPDLRPLTDRLKERIQIIGKVASDPELQLVLNTLQEVPKPILEDILDPEWGFRVKLADRNELLANPSLLIPYMDTNKRTEAHARSLVNGAGAMYSSTSNAGIGGDLFVFTGKGHARKKENILHELGHTVDHRLKYRFLTDKVAEAKKFGFRDEGTSFGASDRSNFLTDHRIDFERFAKNNERSKLEPWLKERLNYYSDADLRTINRVNEAGAIETFAETFTANLKTNQADPLANAFKQFFPLTMKKSELMIEAVYGATPPE
jgi:hypothetical protein